MRGAMTSGMSPADRVVIERLLGAKMAEKWPEMQASARPDTPAARDKAPGANAKPSGTAVRAGGASGQADGKTGRAGAEADVSRRKDDANGTREGAAKGAAGARTAPSHGEEGGTVGRAHSDDEAAASEGGGGEGGCREGPGGERMKVCWSCGKDETEAGKFKKCDACARARYCSREA